MNEIYTLTEALFITWCTTEARWSPMWPKYEQVAVRFFTGNRLKELPPTVFLVCAVLGTRRPPTCIVWRKAGEGGEGGEGAPEQLFLPPLSDRSFAAGTLPLPHWSTTPWRWTRGSLCRSTTTPTCSTSNRWHFQSRASSGYCQFTKVEVLSTLSDGCEGEMSDSNSDKWVGRAVTRKGFKIGGKSKAPKLPEFSQITSFPPAHKKQCPPCQPNNCTNSSEPIILRGNEGSIKFFKPRFKCKCI